MRRKEGRLVGMKAIADYLQISDRNIYRWEKDLGLPVHRTGGVRHRSVFAYVDELDQWLMNRSSPGTTRSKHIKLTVWIAAAASVLTVGISAWLLLRGTPEHPAANGAGKNGSPAAGAVSFITENNLCHVLSAGGERLWSFIFKAQDNPPLKWDPSTNIDYRDIDGDGRNEVAAVVYDSRDRFFRLTLFSGKGAVLWSRLITNGQSFDGLLLRDGFGPTYLFFVADRNGEVSIVSAWNHARFVSLICRHDLKGRHHDLYVHTGHIQDLARLDLNGDGEPEILFTATNNLLDGEGVVGILPFKDFRGVCPPRRIEPEYRARTFHLKSYLADDPRTGNELAYIRFRPPARLTRYRVKHTFAKFDKLDTRHFGIFNPPWALAPGQPHFGLYYVFDGYLRLKDILPTPETLSLYPRMLEQSGIELSLDRAVEISREGVMRWRGDGWTRIEQADVSLRGAQRRSNLVFTTAPDAAS